MSDLQPTTPTPAEAEAGDAPVEGRDPTKCSPFWTFTRFVTRPVMVLLFDLKVHRRHYIPKRGGVLIISNHQSYLDPVLVAVYLHRPMAYMARSQLFKNKYFAWVIRALNAFPIRQGAGDIGALKETIKRLKEGWMLNVFPEGARTFSGDLGPIEPGAALVIRRAKVPVVPCVIEGSYEAFPRTTKWPKPHPISVMYGPPLKVEGLKSEEITQLIDRTLREMIEELREIRRHPWAAQTSMT